MGFCTVVNCMDGRIQLPVIHFLKEKFGVDYVDNITEPGPDGVLARLNPDTLVASILRRVEISVTKHNSVGIAVVGHADCAGNPVSEDEHHQHIREAVKNLRKAHPDLPVVGLWVNEKWEVQEVPVE